MTEAVTNVPRIAGEGTPQGPMALHTSAIASPSSTVAPGASAAAAAVTQSFGTDGESRASLGAAGDEIAPPARTSLGMAGAGAPLAATECTATATPPAVLTLLREFGRDELAITIDEPGAVFGERGRFALSSMIRLSSTSAYPLVALVLLLQYKDQAHSQYLSKCIKLRDIVLQQFVKRVDRGGVLDYLLGGSEDSVADCVLPVEVGGAPVAAAAAAAPLHGMEHDCADVIAVQSTHELSFHTQP